MWGKEVLGEHYHASNNLAKFHYYMSPKNISGIYLESAILIVSTKTLCFRSKTTSYLGTDHLTWRRGLWFFVSFRIYFSDNTDNKSWNIYFFCRAKCEFIFQKLTLGYMTKTLNQINFFLLHQNQNIFLEKNHIKHVSLYHCHI